MHDDCSIPELLARIERGDIEAYFAWCRRAAKYRQEEPGEILVRIRIGLERLAHPTEEET